MLRFRKFIIKLRYVNVLSDIVDFQMSSLNNFLWPGQRTVVYLSTVRASSRWGVVTRPSCPVSGKSLTASSGGTSWWTCRTSINRTGNRTTASGHSSRRTASAGRGRGLSHLHAAASSVCKTVHEVPLHVSYCKLGNSLQQIVTPTKTMGHYKWWILKSRDFHVFQTGKVCAKENEDLFT